MPIIKIFTCANDRGQKPTKMQAKLIFLSLLLATFDFIKASSNGNESLMSDDSSVENESLTTDDLTPSFGKRSLDHVSAFESESPRTLTSSLKRLRASPNLSARRHPDAIAESSYLINGAEAEDKYFRALYKGQHVLADEMRKQGLMLSGSNTTYFYVNSLLRNENDVTSLLELLIRTQPQVFSQEYQCGKTVFQNATQTNIDYILSRFKYSAGVRFMIFREALRDPSVKLGNDFYYNIRPNRACEMIELAEVSGRPDLISRCRFLTGSLEYHNLAGETFFTEAVKAKNLTRINWLVLRLDAVELILLENSNGQNCVDLAIELFDKGIDPDYSVMRSLFKVITSSYRTGSVDGFDKLFEEFLQHITEADDNIILIKALKQELNSAKEFALAKDVKDLADDFVKFIDNQFIALCQIEQANKTSHSYEDNEKDEEEETDDDEGDDKENHDDFNEEISAGKYEYNSESDLESI